MLNLFVGLLTRFVVTWIVEFLVNGGLLVIILKQWGFHCLHFFHRIFNSVLNFGSISRSKEAFLEDTNSTSEDDCGEHYQGKRSCDNHIPVRILFSIDSEHETKSNGSSNHAGVPNENQLFERHFRLVAKNLKQFNEYHCSESSTKNDDAQLDKEELWRPHKCSKREESEAKICEHKSFGGISQELKHYEGGLLTLGGQVKPCVMGHHDSAGQKWDDTGLFG